MTVKHFIIVDAAMLDASYLLYERLKDLPSIVPCAQVFRTRRAANSRARDLEQLLGYPQGLGYLQVLQVNQPKEPSL